MHTVNGASHFNDRVGQRFASFKGCQQRNIVSLLPHNTGSPLQYGKSLSEGQAIAVLQVCLVGGSKRRINMLFAASIDFGQDVLIISRRYLRTPGGWQVAHNHQWLL
jgi:hypothetical protein